MADHPQNFSNIGACSELIACAHFLKEGYEVFRNVSPVGKRDIVIYKDGEYTSIDVTTGRYHECKDGTITKLMHAGKLRECKKLGIKVVTVFPDHHVQID
jgi:predicted RecB family endonuclease